MKEKCINEKMIKEVLKKNGIAFADEDIGFTNVIAIPKSYKNINYCIHLMDLGNEVFVYSNINTGAIGMCLLAPIALWVADQNSNESMPVIKLDLIKGRLSTDFSKRFDTDTPDTIIDYVAETESCVKHIIDTIVKDGKYCIPVKYTELYKRLLKSGLNYLNGETTNEDYEPGCLEEMASIVTKVYGKTFQQEERLERLLNTNKKETLICKPFDEED